MLKGLLGQILPECSHSFFSSLAVGLFFLNLAQANVVPPRIDHYFDTASLVRGPSTLRVFWWNIEKGDTNRNLLKLTGERPLDTNLKELLSNPLQKPDVLALGEYTGDSLSPETLRLIHSSYKFVEITPYNPESKDLSILFATNLDVVQKTSLPLDFVPISEGNAFRNTFPTTEEESIQDSFYRTLWTWKLSESEPELFRRTFSAYQLKLQSGKPIIVVPVHLMMPWTALKMENGTASTALEIFSGIDNPLIEQLKRLILYARAEQEKRKTPLVMIGDFNLPKERFWTGFQDSTGYEILKNYFTDLFYDDTTPTFPTASSEWAHSELGQPKTSGLLTPDMKLDHAFLLRGRALIFQQDARAPRLNGSDHYPIWTQLDLVFP